MKNIKLICPILVVTIATSLGCGKSSSFSLLNEEDIFNQSVGTFNSKVDILWMIDNSGSMQTSQTNVVNNLNSFIQDFTTKQLDYQMAVAATDSYKVQFNGKHDCSTFRDGIRTTSNCTTVAGKSYSGVDVMTPSTLNPLTVFMTNVSLTDDVNNLFGSGDERAFQSIMRAIEEPNNAGFLRPGAFLSIIIVSDEDDFSHDTSTFTENYSDPSLYSISSVTSYLDALTSSNLSNRRYNVHAMAVYDAACRTALGGGSVKVNQRYSLLVDDVNAAFSDNALKGKKTSLCGDFANDLKSIADAIQTLSSEFKLQRIPKPETIAVIVDGVLVPNKDTNPLLDGGWFYDPTKNSIFFTIKYVPTANASIKVTYDPVAYGS